MVPSAATIAMTMAPAKASIAALRRRRRKASRLAAMLACCTKPWRQPEPIDGGNRHHRQEQRNLDQQQPAVIGAVKRGQRCRRDNKC